MGNPSGNPMPKDIEPLHSKIIAPDYLGEEETNKFYSLISKTHWGIIATSADIDLIAEYCKAFFAKKDFEKELEKQGHVLVNDKGNSYANPLVKITRDLSDYMYRIAREFGGTPAARARIGIALTENEKEESDVFAGLLN